MGRVYKRGDLYYMDYVDENGKRVRKKAAPKKADAEAMLRAEERLVDEIKAGLKVRNDRQINELEVLKGKYVEHLKARKLSQKTITNVDKAYRRVLVDAGWTLVTDITRDSLTTRVLKLQEKARNQTINLYITFLNGLFNWAVNGDYIQKNPLRTFSRLKVTELDPRRDLSPEEINRLLKFLHGYNREWYTRVMVYAHTGLRSEAGQQLRWEWINWDKDIILLPREHNKSNREHRIPLTKPLREALLSWQGGVIKIGNVFPFTTVGHRSVTFKSLVAKAGIDTEGVCLHSLRHSVATLVYKRGGLKAAQELLGHANGATTMRYLHASLDEVRSATEVLDFDGKQQEKTA